MLSNTAYCGYVSARRDKSKAIKGLHEAIVPEELFDRVQLMRRQRARTLHPATLTTLRAAWPRALPALPRACTARSAGAT